jgi:hypothetical protein
LQDWASFSYSETTKNLEENRNEKQAFGCSGGAGHSFGCLRRTYP